MSYGQLSGPPDDALYYKTCFAYLVKCLWFNGFAVAVVFSGTDKLKRPPILNLHVKIIIEKHTSTINKLDGVPLILLGSSETGHAMASFAYRLTVKTASSYKYFPRATAVIGLGPVGSQLNLYGKDFSPNYLVIAGTHDGEVSNDQSTYAYEYHDSILGFKSLVLLHGANHGRFVQFEPEWSNYYIDPVDLSDGLQILPRTQRLVVAQYVTMFSLMVTNSGDYANYRSVFKGDKIIDFIPTDDFVDQDLKKRFRATPLYASRAKQFPLTSGENKITFVSLFQNGDELINAQHPPVYAPLDALAPLVCYHTSSGYRVNWATGWAINPSLVVEIAATVRFGPEPKYLEFDAVQMPLSVFNSLTELDVQAKLVYYGKMTKAVAFRIQPSHSFAAPLHKKDSRAVLSTIRLAVADFGVNIGHFKEVTYLIIELTALARPAGEILFTPFRWTI